MARAHPTVTSVACAAGSIASLARGSSAQASVALHSRGTSNMENIRGRRHKCACLARVGPVPGGVMPPRRPAASRRWMSARDGTVRSFAAFRCRPARDSLGSASRCGSRFQCLSPSRPALDTFTERCVPRSAQAQFLHELPVLAQCAQVQRYLLWRLSAVSPLSKHVRDGIVVCKSTCCYQESPRQTFGPAD